MAPLAHSPGSVTQKFTAWLAGTSPPESVAANKTWPRVPRNVYQEQWCVAAMVSYSERISEGSKANLTRPWFVEQ